MAKFAKRVPNGKKKAVGSCTLEELANSHIERGTLEQMVEFMLGVGLEGKAHKFVRLDKGRFAISALETDSTPVDDVRVRMDALTRVKTMLYGAATRHVDVRKTTVQLSLSGHIEESLESAKRVAARHSAKTLVELGLDPQEPGGYLAAPLSVVDVQVSDHGHGDPEGAPRELGMAQGNDRPDELRQRVRQEHRGDVPGEPDPDGEPPVLDVQGEDGSAGRDDET